jgi:hypothetical protein
LFQRPSTKRKFGALDIVFSKAGIVNDKNWRIEMSVNVMGNEIKLLV